MTHSWIMTTGISLIAFVVTTGVASIPLYSIFPPEGIFDVGSTALPLSLLFGFLTGAVVSALLGAQNRWLAFLIYATIVNFVVYQLLRVGDSALLMIPPLSIVSLF